MSATGTPVAPGTATAVRAPTRLDTWRRLSTRRKVGRVLTNLLGLAVFAVMIFPVYWMISTAFKPGHDILSYTPKWFPVPATLSNFDDAIHMDYFWRDALNSLIVTVSVVAFSTVLALLAALALARFKFYGRRAFIVLMIGVQMVPLNALIIPIYIVMARANQVDRLTGVIVTYLTFVLPFTIWTLRGFLLGVPKELEEAAMVDGCTRLGAFWRILVPLITPGLVATSIFGFILAWNEYLIAYVMLHSPERQTLMVWLASFTTSRGTDWGPLMAGATLSALPVVIFFLLVHRRIAFGLTAGAVRG
jgi:N,N'-diacetylchitobiose transport system permease protein